MPDKLPVVIVKPHVLCESSAQDRGASLGIGVGPHAQDVFHESCGGAHRDNTPLLSPERAQWGGFSVEIDPITPTLSPSERDSAVGGWLAAHLPLPPLGVKSEA